MSRISFENYGRLAKTNNQHTVIAGRYGVQRGAERRIPLDVAQKLVLQAEDRLLEIGCGTGNLLIPLSFMVGEATGVDHEMVIKRLGQRFNLSEISGITGNFLDLTLSDKFDAILIYSVLHNLSSADEVFLFLEKALDRLAPHGRMLIGDIPNEDRKKAFLDSPEGKSFQKDWNKQKDNDDELLNLPADPDTFSFNNKWVGKIIEFFENNGCNATVLRQPVDLPFGHTREDILVRQNG